MTVRDLCVLAAAGLELANRFRLARPAFKVQVEAIAAKCMQLNPA